MKQFDLKLAKAGHPVCTRDGRKARIVCYDARITSFPLFVLVDNDGIEQGFAYNEQGHRPYTDGDNDPNDLMMASTKHEKYIVLKVEEGKLRIASDVLFPTKEMAVYYKRHCEGAKTILKIEWEE